MTKTSARAAAPPPRTRLLVGGAILVVGLLCPLLVPAVAASELPASWKVPVSGLMLLGIPELFTLAAVAVLGKPGFEHLKGLLLAFLGRHAPARAVGPTRYRVGLAMLLVPVGFGWIAPFAAEWIPGYVDHRVAFALAGDFLLVASLFVLGGDFWDKLRALFVHRATARFPGS
jgi:hypothetical protein